jgi:hypothetical protein
MEQVSPAVSVVFIAATFAAVGLLMRAAKAAGTESLPYRILVFVFPLWILFQGAIALSGFYYSGGANGARLLLFGVAPSLVFVLAYLIVFRNSFVSKLPMKLLIAVHIVRIPVEIVLYWLYQGGQIPRDMTFAGYNYDIVTGVFGIILLIYLNSVEKPSRLPIWAFNFVGLALLAVVVVTAIVSTPGPLQMVNFDQPNVAVLFLPYIWLPTIVVPIVIFAHFASLTQLMLNRDNVN